MKTDRESRCVTPGCGHVAWAHGDQSGFPSSADPCHAALGRMVVNGQVEVEGRECPCTSYLREDPL